MIASVKLQREIIYRKLFPGQLLPVEERQNLRKEKDKVTRLFFFLKYGLKHQIIPTGASGKERRVYRLLLQKLVEKKELDEKLLASIEDWPEARE